ncbi:unnamed protein product [Bursaphelenchus xylophilus]|uniref:(pine wood nematode) hypothetical protein n=1 Tax=Bursaphelenchus xylophilus TaxID=6326 RepID=A0A7I8XE61_BURXY|nr:unnamed protein product [Bursaphelenchus xylophilus]CAG9114189.1 unnamed protein product [Bursaphelenchus xylophilus]
MTKRKKLELFKRIRHPHAQSLITAISDILGFLFLMIFTCPALYKVEIHSSKNCLENGFFRLYLAGLICSILLLIGAICKAITPYFIYISFKIVFIIMFPTQLMHDGSYEKAKNSEHALALFYGGLVFSRNQVSIGEEEEGENEEDQWSQ